MIIRKTKTGVTVGYNNRKNTISEQFTSLVTVFEEVMKDLPQKEKKKRYINNEGCT